MKGAALAIVQAIESGAHTVKQIAEVTGKSHDVVRTRLSELRGVGAVHTHQLRSVGKWGRPESFHRLNQWA